jgi:hypothetical protein
MQGVFRGGSISEWTANHAWLESNKGLPHVGAEVDGDQPAAKE